MCNPPSVSLRHLAEDQKATAWMTTELNERQQKVLDRRASYLDSLLGLVP
jgi:hypothetical protein